VKGGEGNGRRSKNRGIGNEGRYAKAFDQNGEAGEKKKKNVPKKGKNVSQHFFFLGKRKPVLKEKGGMEKRWREEEIWERHVPCKESILAKLS
jgi:hypothetical protein